MAKRCVTSLSACNLPVALPATFTLAAAVGARALARLGVLPTRLSAVDEAATLDVLCSDKTGTLTRDALEVTAIRPEPGFDEAHVLAMAALASSDGGQDPVDAAIRLAARKGKIADLPKVTKFVAFDPATRMSEVTAVDANGGNILPAEKNIRSGSALKSRLKCPIWCGHACTSR